MTLGLRKSRTKDDTSLKMCVRVLRDEPSLWKDIEVPQRVESASWRKALLFKILCQISGVIDQRQDPDRHDFITTGTLRLDKGVTLEK